MTAALGTLTLNEWTGLTVAALWLTFGLLAVRLLRPAFKGVLRTPALVAAALALLAGAGLGADAFVHFNRPVAVVVVPEAIARSGPFDEAQTTFTAHDGAELAIQDRRNDWLQVTDGSGRIGWLERGKVSILPGI